VPDPSSRKCKQKIQFVLRQTVYYLRETKASTSTLRPPPVDGIPTPFASTLLTGSRGRSGDEEGQREGEGEEVELGLYGRRMEARTLREMAEALRELKRQTGGEGKCRTGWRASGGDGGG